MGHTILNRSTVVADFRKPLAWDDVERLPLGELLVEACLDFGAVVVRRSRRPVAAYPSVLAALAGLEFRLHAALVDDRVELRAHLAILRLPLDLVAVDHLAAVGIGTRAGSAGDRARRLFPGLLYDLESADTVLGTVATSGVSPEAHTGATGGQPPVRRQRNEASAVGATDAVGVDVGHIHDVGQPGLREHVLQWLLDSLPPSGSQCLELVGKLTRELCGPCHRGLRNKRRDRIEVVSKCDEP